MIEGADPLPDSVLRFPDLRNLSEFQRLGGEVSADTVESVAIPSSGMETHA